MDSIDITLRRLDGPSLASALPDLHALLRDAVEGGASVGFHPPLDPGLSEAYWDGVAADVARGTRVLIAARDGAGRVVGSVQLDLCQRQNGPHRAELQKLLVLASHRRRGLGSLLMGEAEREARDLGRTTLVLDTLKGDSAEPLYARLGWTRVGEIPAYTREVDGSYGATVVFYRHL